MGARAQKEQKVMELSERFRKASGAVFADFRGLTVKDALELRRTLRQAETNLLVAKNTLTRLAVKEVGLDEAVLQLLEGPTAIAFIGGDPVAGARALMDSTKRFPALVVKGAVVEGKVLAQEQAQALATLDTRDVSLAKVAGLLQAPLQRIAYVLQAPLQRIAFALAERGRQEAPTEAETSEAVTSEAGPASEAEPAEPGQTEPEAPAAAETEREGLAEGDHAPGQDEQDGAPSE
jgi:large subunit ribosomal protein L10